MCTIWGKIKKLTWLQPYDLGDEGVIWCNTLGDSLFQILCDEFCRLRAYCYSHITSHISQVFASFTHYTSYSLLNIVHVIVCVFRFDQPSLQIFGVLNLKGECLKILILGKLGLKLVFWKSISSHTHAFYSLYSMLWGVFSKTGLFFSKILFFQNFD